MEFRRREEMVAKIAVSGANDLWKYGISPEKSAGSGVTDL
jgi:hypothetical protein